MKYGDKSEPTPLPAETPFALEPRAMTTRTITVEALWEQLLPLIRMKDQARARAIFAALPAEPAQSRSVQRRKNVLRGRPMEEGIAAEPAGATGLREAVSAAVWAWLEAQPGFNEQMAQAEADLAAGKGTPFAALAATTPVGEGEG